jgi:hypothetical protein
MRSTLTLRTLTLAAALAGGLALAPPAHAAGGRPAGPLGWLYGLFTWDRLSWLTGEVGSAVDPNGAPSHADGEVGAWVDPDGALSHATGEVGAEYDPNG